MKVNFKRTLEIATNIAIVVLTIIVVYSFVSSRLKAKPENGPTVGTQFSSNRLSWADNGSTLLVVLQRGCKYCDESAPFYKKLYEARGSAVRPRIVAVVPSVDLKEANEYLSDHGISVDTTLNDSLSDFKVTATPTLLLVDKAGTIKDVWVGKLPADKEHQVLDRILKF